MSSGLSEEEIQEILRKARTQNGDSSATPAEMPAPQRLPNGDAEEEEFLDLSPLESEVPLEQGSGSAADADPHVGQLFEPMEGDLGLPDPSEEDGALETIEEAGLSADGPMRTDPQGERMLDPEELAAGDEHDLELGGNGSGSDGTDAEPVLGDAEKE
jgi:hypothetical protein